MTLTKQQREMNHERVNRIYDIWRTYEAKVCDTPEEFVTDLLADLMHYCNREKLAFPRLLDMARSHFYCEQKGID
jgi:hypothetical protein